MTKLLAALLSVVASGIGCDRSSPEAASCPTYTIESVGDHKCDQSEDHCLTHLASTGMQIFFMTKNHAVLEDALRYSELGVRTFPESWDLLQVHVNLLGIAERDADAKQLLPRMEKVAASFEQWAALSSLFEVHGMRDEAVNAYEKAAALAVTAPVEATVLRQLRRGLFAQPAT